MPTILITGVPGSGKSSVAFQLSVRGYRAIDADEDPELSGWAPREASTSDAPEMSMAWFTSHQWQWNPRRLNEFAEEVGSDPLFVCGSASNQDELFDWFDKVILLSLDVETLAERLEAIDRETGQGDGDGDTRDQIAGWLPQRQDHLRNQGALVVDATQPLDRVIADILEHV